MNNKVSEKVVWDNSIPSDNDSFTPTTSQMHTHPQMMFCYKCENVIPGDSVYCPYCQVKLFTECPKCGAKYSSQYPACSQCGTNRFDYIEQQRREQERKDAIERENRRQREIAERKRLEEERRRKEAEEERERQKRLQAHEQKENERKQKETYLKENEEIMKTKEYEATYSLLSKAIEDYGKKANNIGCIYVLLFTLTIMFTLFCVHPVLGFILMIVLPFFSDNIIEKAKMKRCRKHLQKYISSNNNLNNHMVTPDLIDMVSYQGKERLPDCCIIAYRKRHQLPYNYSYHSLR